MSELHVQKPKQITKRLVGSLPAKAQDVVRRRFGLDEKGERMTLESIGQIYDITRERVRQIEQSAIQTIRASKEFKEFEYAWNQLRNHFESFAGGVAHEDHYLEHVAKNDEQLRNHIRFYMVLGEPFAKLKEDDEFNHRWVSNKETSEAVHGALKKLHASMVADELLSDAEMLERFASHLREHAKNISTDPETMRRWLAMSKVVAKNPLGDWGVADSPNIKIRGVRDLAFLVLRRHGQPLHFADVAKTISKQFGRSAHVATCHNELIKDGRFVLVGRGLYALTEWGYNRGTVRDIIRSVLQKYGPLTKSEIVDRVTKERFVKESTISVNLQNSKYFKRDHDGKYTIVEKK